jgi:hypothetical protein
MLHSPRSQQASARSERPAKAREMAGKALDRLIDPSDLTRNGTPASEGFSRGRKSFRDIRDKRVSQKADKRTAGVRRWEYSERHQPLGLDPQSAILSPGRPGALFLCRCRRYTPPYSTSRLYRAVPSHKSRHAAFGRTVACTKSKHDILRVRGAAGRALGCWMWARG